MIERVPQHSFRCGRDNEEGVEIGGVGDEANGARVEGSDGRKKSSIIRGENENVATTSSDNNEVLGASIGYSSLTVEGRIRSVIPRAGNVQDSALLVINGMNSKEPPRSTSDKDVARRRVENRR